MASVLIFEDDTDLVSQWMQALRKRGHRVVQAFTFQEACKVLEGETFDVIIIDIFIRDSEQKLEKSGGLSLLGRVNFMNENGRRPRTITVTGSVPTSIQTVDLLAHAEKLGTDRTLRKPIDVDELMRTVEALAES